MDQFRFSQNFVHKNDQEKITFTCLFDTFAYRRIPLSLCNTPATFQRCMTDIFTNYRDKNLKVLMGDSSLYGFAVL